jgi:CelD/BcsL family acetyltransferase involved in cellulose biosynthesis
MLQIKILRTISECEAIAAEWNDLLTCCSASHVPFLRQEYLSTWWNTLGGGEWVHGELFTVLAKNQDGQLVGIAPLFFTKNQQGDPSLMLQGSIEISDYLDLIVSHDAILEFIEILLDILDSERSPAWQVLDWYNIPEDSPTLPALRIAVEQRGWSYDQTRLQPCPNIQLPGDWETYLAGIEKKQRHEIRRKMRRAEEFDPPVHWFIADDMKELDANIDDFLALMAQDSAKARFLTDAMRIQMHSIGKIAFQGGWLQLAFLESGDKKVAGYMNFDYAGHIWIYNSGFDSGFLELSPGWVLLSHLLKWANENKRISLDFMRGDEDYKYRFGGVNRYIVRALIRR